MTKEDRMLTERTNPHEQAGLADLVGGMLHWSVVQPLVILPNNAVSHGLIMPAHAEAAIHMFLLL